MSLLHYIILPASVIVVTNDGQGHTLLADHPYYKEVREALVEDGDQADVVDLLSPVKKLYDMFISGPVKVENGRVYLFDQLMEGEAEDHLVNLVLDPTANKQEIDATVAFIINVNDNPSFNSRRQLWSFIKRNGITLTLEGQLVLYKGVNPNYTDCHTGTIDNSIGTTHEMARSRVDDNPNSSCSFGFHAGAYDYVQTFGYRKMVVVVNPADVVSVPHDANETKIRCCRYEVIGELDADEFQTEEPFKNQRIYIPVDEYF